MTSYSVILSVHFSASPVNCNFDVQRSLVLEGDINAADVPALGLP
jgi:hypothetical protein